MAGIINFQDYIKTDGVSKDFKALSDQLTKLEQKFTAIIENTKKVNTELQNQSATQSKTNKAIKETNKSLDVLAQAEKETIKLQQDTSKVIAKARAERTEDNKKLVQAKIARQEQNKRIKEEIQLTRQASGSYEQLDSQLKIAIQQYKKLSAAERQGAKGKQLQQKIQGLDKELKGLDAGIGKHQRNVGNYASAIDGIPGPMGRAAQGVKMLGQQFLKLLKNPIVLVITLIVGAIAALVKAFKSSDAGATEFAARMEQLKAIVDVVRQRLIDFVKTFTILFDDSLSWKERFKELGNVFSGMGEQIQSATKAAYEYQYALDSLNDQESSYISQAEKTALAIAKLEFTAQNRAKSTNERAKALQDAISIGEQEVLKQKEFADRRLQIELDYLAGKYQITTESIRQLIDADDEQTKVLLENNADLASFRNKLGDENYKKLEELYSKSLQVERKYYEENKRNLSRLSGFQEEIRKDTIDAIERDAEKELQIQKEKLLNKEINELQFASAVLDIQIRTAERQLEISNLTEEERLKFRSQLLDLQLQKEKEYQDALVEIENSGNDIFAQIEAEQAEKTKELNAQELEDFKEKEKEKIKTAEERAKIEEEIEKKKGETIKNIGSSVADFLTALRDREMAEIEQREAFELKLAGDNEAAKQGIQEKFAREKTRIQREQAIQNKLFAAFSAGINVAQGITAALNMGAAGIPLAILIGILGAIQIATIAATPLPFWKGTGPEGLPDDTYALFGEKGREIVHEPGKMPYVADRPTVDMLPKGTRIIPNYETEKILSDSGGMSEQHFAKLVEEQRQTRNAIENIPVNITNITERGFEHQTKRGNTTIKWLNKHFGE